jgi:excisionase family DNA binding protein
MTLLTAREAAQYLHISLFTLGRIEKEGLLVPFRTPGGHRRYSLEMLNEYLERSRVRLSGREKRILVVDEGKEMVDLLTRTFRAYRCSTASDALGVGVKLAEFKPDLVVVNTKMSGLDGLDLCRRLKREREKVKVLAYEAPQEREVHPSNLDGLKERIEDLLGERSLGGPSNV